MGKSDATRFVVYPGPYPEITLKNVPFEIRLVKGKEEYAELQDVAFIRGEPLELPAKVADYLIKREKVVASNAPAPKKEAPTTESSK